ncbi:MAG: AarF/ABC1/UbiB kinase family protein [Anaerolineales bacterium]|nr:AarF/ABC1/UbiB kinase family protein [Anaerolineales bacterium]
MLRSRYRRIVTFFARVLISIAFWDLLLPRLGLSRLAARTRSERLLQVARQYRALAVAMGGVLIKVGQFLSSRVDVLPREITAELEGLQDEVPAESFEDIRRVAEAELGLPLAEKFDFFDEQPLAAASLGQVHQARLPSYQTANTLEQDNAPPGAPEFLEVVVKVQRPEIERIIATDLAALRTVGNWLHRYPPIRRRADVPALLVEFTRTLYEEIDYLAEGRNAETFAVHFKANPTILVPRVVWTYTTRRVLTLEDVRGIKITNYDAITAAGVDRRQVAARLLNAYFKQIFDDGFFHADPHPGNLFVRPIQGGDPGSRAWQLTFIDFGMVGRIQPEMRAGMRELIIAVGTQDAQRMVRSYQMMGVLLPSADLELLEKAEAEIFKRFWGKSMSDLTNVSVQELTDFAGEFRQLVYDLPFQVPQDIIFLVRAIGILSGMCTGLDPEFNLFNHLIPFSKKLLSEEAPAGIEAWLGELGAMARRLWSLPTRAEAVLSQAEKGQLVVRDPELQTRVSRLQRAVSRAAAAIIFAALLLGSIQLYLAGEDLLAGLMGGGAAIILLWMILPRKM